MDQKIEQLKGKLIVSCQALPEEPLHSSFIMGRMALAAKEGGAAGIRANTKEDIKEIRAQVDLPVIGIVKQNYEMAGEEFNINSTKHRKSNVKISILCPGPVATNFNEVANVKFHLREANSMDVAKYAIEKLQKGKFYIVPRNRCKNREIFC